MMGLTLRHWKNDVPAGLVVFLVAVPLCLGIALASGAPPLSGILAGIVGGLVVTPLSGSALGVSGPAAGLAVIVFEAIAALRAQAVAAGLPEAEANAEAFQAFLLAVVIGGVLQFLLGVAKAGIVAYYIPSSVIKGMLAAIGVILILKQLPHAVGYDADFEGDESFVQADGHNTISELFYMFDAVSLGAVVVAVVSLAILIGWETPVMKKLKFTGLVQGPLVAVATGIGLGYAFEGSGLAIAPAHMVALPVLDSLSDIDALITVPKFSAITDPLVWKLGVTIAIVATVATLLYVEAADKLDPEKRVTPSNQELRAQGIGNLVAGLIGGLPLTQVIVRSSTNVTSGAKTKLSSFIHGICILLAVLVFPQLMNRIPLSCLAAVLIVVGSKLARVSLFKAMYRAGLSQFLPFIVTLVAIVFTDLLTGIGVGMVVAVFFVLYNNHELPFHVDHRTDADGRRTYEFRLSQDVSFLNRGRIMKTLYDVPDGSHIIIDRSQVVTMHPDVEEVIADFRQYAENHHDIVLEMRETADAFSAKGKTSLNAEDVRARPAEAGDPPAAA